ncbi:hypothetical protein N480_00365 [Pseudoalteromonas luteoviolacea S2607]|uniref:hypothetical protein n=1 Tax=Pseudoalteromonas luteoviolacea TaxID=43657 RepID=UPI0007B0AB54|nr:hypothetical protein [Pseudoalteromonas luteoviolacea]KZN39314.1 hypothetical protein N480_00365 [Pseudoalteromonas luteoviolacea S2607]
MYFWNLKSLAKELIEDNIHDWQKVKYYLATLYLGLFSQGVLAYFIGWRLDALGFASYIPAAFIVYFYVAKIYNSTKSIEGKISPLELFVVLGFPATMRATVGFWVIYFVLLLLYGILETSYTYLAIFHFALVPVYYWYFFHCIEKSIESARE